MGKPPFWVLRLAHWILADELAALEAKLRQAQAANESIDLSMTICRAMLATTMRERDRFEAAFEHLACELATTKRLRRRERRTLRHWITREVKPHIRTN
jgi:hypothetical protein